MVLADAPAGQYDIWVASYQAGTFVEGSLQVTQSAGDVALDPSGALEPGSDPYYGSRSLAQGFLPDPVTEPVRAGGWVDVSYLGSPCVGYAAVRPDFRLQWEGSSGGAGNPLRIFFEAGNEGEGAGDEPGDATLLVRSPDGAWSCNDDARSGTRNPMVILDDPGPGRYEIWVGSYTQGNTVDGILQITERAVEPR